MHQGLLMGYHDLTFPLGRIAMFRMKKVIIDLGLDCNFSLTIDRSELNRIFLILMSTSIVHVL